MAGSTALRRAQTLVLGPVRGTARRVLGSSVRQSYLRRALKRAVDRRGHPLRVILGGGCKLAPRGWCLTDAEILDITRPEHWQGLFGSRRADALLAEHVWEHLPPETGLEAACQCRRYLRDGGTLRIAVPDGLHPHAEYREHVRPGGLGPGASDHEVLFTHDSLTALLERAGFSVVALEYWDRDGRFHHEPWTADLGPVRRRPRFAPDEASFMKGPEYAAFNDDSISPKRRITSDAWPFNYTSLIVDARKETDGASKGAPVAR